MPVDLEALARLIEADLSKRVPEKPEGEERPESPTPTGQRAVLVGREIRALWFKTPPRPLPPQVLKRVGAVPEIHGLQGCWNMAGNRLPAEELKALLDLFASQGEAVDPEVGP